MAYFVFACRCLLLVVFGFSALGKLWGAGSFTAFRRATGELVPPARAHTTALAVTVLGAESAIVVLLAVPMIPWLGLGFSIVLLLAFSVAISAALRRGSTAPCHCFGGSAAPLGVRHLVRNAGLVLMAVAGLSIEVVGTAGAVQAEAHPLGLVMAAIVAVVLAALVLCFDALADLFVGTPSPFVGTPSPSAVPSRRYPERITT